MDEEEDNVADDALYAGTVKVMTSLTYSTNRRCRVAGRITFFPSRTSFVHRFK